MPEWIDAKLAIRAVRVLCECGAQVAFNYIADRELSRIQQEAMTPQELTPEEVAREWLRVRKEIRRVAAGLPAVEPPKPRTYECPDCKSCITNNKNCIKTHRRTLKHLNAVKAATTA